MSTSIQTSAVTNTIQQALKTLEKTVHVITHSNSFPSLPEHDTGVGSPYTEGAAQYLRFLASMGVQGIQLGPDGKLKPFTRSPYDGTAFSKSPLLIDLYQLTQAHWDHILPLENFAALVDANPNKDVPRVAFKKADDAGNVDSDYIFNAYTQTLRVAYTQFKQLKNASFTSELTMFMLDNSDWLEKDGLYEALSTFYQTDYWPAWSQKSDDWYVERHTNRTWAEVDQQLFSPNIDLDIRRQRMIALQQQLAEEIELYAFCQFVIHRQHQVFLATTASLGLAVIGDRQIAFSDRDVWAHPHYFLQDWRMGVPPDEFSPDKGQEWGFYVLDPLALFNAHGQLNESGAGGWIKRLYKKLFVDYPGGVRIDHTVGLIDPWVYPTGGDAKNGARLFSTPSWSALSPYCIVAEEQLKPALREADDRAHEDWVAHLDGSQVKRYARFIEHVIIAAAEEAGVLWQRDMIWEDLGTLTYPVVQVMQYLNLGGMRVTQFIKLDAPMEDLQNRGLYLKPNQVATLGTHDNLSILEKYREIQANPKQWWEQAWQLATDVYPSEPTQQQAEMLSASLEAMVQAKMAELFTCPAKRIQIMFTDLLGMDETYNRPGKDPGQSDTWTLRVPNEYERLWQNNVRQNKGMVFPRLLATAFLAKEPRCQSGHTDLLAQLQSMGEIS